MIWCDGMDHSRSSCWACPTLRRAPPARWACAARPARLGTLADCTTHSANLQISSPAKSACRLGDSQASGKEVKHSALGRLGGSAQRVEGFSDEKGSQTLPPDVGVAHLQAYLNPHPKESIRRNHE
jgi:hypothetical protein